jgi:hypothetical protein
MPWGQFCESEIWVARDNCIFHARVKFIIIIILGQLNYSKTHTKSTRESRTNTHLSLKCCSQILRFINLFANCTNCKKMRKLQSAFAWVKKKFYIANVYYNRWNYVMVKKSKKTRIINLIEKNSEENHHFAKLPAQAIRGYHYTPLW